MVQPTGWINPQWEEFMPAARSCVEADTTSKGQPAMGGTDAWREASRSLQRLDQKSRMSRAAPVRIREGLGVKLPRATRLLITGISKELLRDQVQPLVAHFLKERGLELSHEKTRITHVENGFDFLGQNVRRYDNGKVLTKPSSASVKTFLSKIQETIDSSGSLTAGEMIRRLNQQIKGWTMYHR